MELPDINVLIYAHREDAPEHDRYAAWLALLALVVSIVAIINRWNPRGAVVVLVLGITAGLLGAYSNST